MKFDLEVYFSDRQDGYDMFEHYEVGSLEECKTIAQINNENHEVFPEDDPPVFKIFMKCIDSVQIFTGYREGDTIVWNKHLDVCGICPTIDQMLQEED